jgi:hypothetical protein
MGIRGIHTAAERIPRWPDQMSADEIRWALFNTYIFVSAQGGTGGGIFRYMFSRFLAEAAVITGEARLAQSAAGFKRIGDDWEAFAAWAKSASESPDMTSRLGECTAPLLAIASQEQTAWEALQQITE